MGRGRTGRFQWRWCRILPHDNVVQPAPNARSGSGMNGQKMNNSHRITTRPFPIPGRISTTLLSCFPCTSVTWAMRSVSSRLCKSCIRIEHCGRGRQWEGADQRHRIGALRIHSHCLSSSPSPANTRRNLLCIKRVILAGCFFSSCAWLCRTNG